jgi:hypothetical protein
MPLSKQQLMLDIHSSDQGSNIAIKNYLNIFRGELHVRVPILPYAVRSGI